jgi:arylsulfatase A-like enzyme
MSDNGAGGNKRGGLSGGKGGVWEGGIRVPLIIRGPGVRPNSWCHTPVVGYDLLPTFCQWAGIAASQLPRGLEGGSIANLLSHDGPGQVKRPREELVFHFPHYQNDETPQSAILLGHLKLLHFYESNRDLLFDLSTDIGERNDLASSMPTETAQLRRRLDTYLKSVSAQLPTANPQFDPSAPVSNARGKGNRGNNNGKRSRPLP